MNRITAALFAACAMLAAGSGVAQERKNGGMAKESIAAMGKGCPDAMGKGEMKQDGTAKGAMPKAAMNKEKMASPDGAMGKGCPDAMGKGAMKQDAMVKDAMKK